MFKEIIFTLALLHLCYAPPVTKEKKESEEPVTDGLEDYIEYHRYIREVVNALESDPTFRDKLEKANEEDIKSGKIALELELVSHNVRTRLDEIKRTELQRLKELVNRKLEFNDVSNNVEDPNHHHVDHANPHTFEIEDLKRLIAKTTEDLAEADRKRRDEFKQYELQKEYEKFEELNKTSGDERKKLEDHYKEMENKHKKHEKLHTPGHKQQLEEVWQEQDHMDQDFNPKTFFMLHDLDSNGLWDQDEVKALFVKELDKMYAASAPEDDLRERVEEMERMRESVFKEMDYNNDGFIDYNEFLHQTKKNDFEKDPGWKGLDEQRPFSDQELDEYIRQHQMQYPPHPGYHPNDINAHMYPDQGYHPQGYQPQGGYQGHPGQMPPQAHHPQQMQHQQQQQQQYHQGQGGHGGQMPPQGHHPQQMQQQQQGYHQGQGGHGGQMPPQAHAQQTGYGGNHPQMQQQAGYPGNHPQMQQQQQQGYQGQQLHPGQLPQAQIHPQQIPDSQQMHHAGVGNAAKLGGGGGVPHLNSNEVVNHPPAPPAAKQMNAENDQGHRARSQERIVNNVNNAESMKVSSGENKRQQGPNPQQINEQLLQAKAN